MEPPLRGALGTEIQEVTGVAMTALDIGLPIGETEAVDWQRLRRPGGRQ